MAGSEKRKPVLNPVTLSDSDVQHITSLLTAIPLDIRLNGEFLPSAAPRIVLTAQIPSEPAPKQPSKPVLQAPPAQPVAAIFSAPKPAPVIQPEPKPTAPKATENLDAWLDDLLS
jgi:hypothetical protein